MDPSKLELICFNDNINSDGFHPLSGTMNEWWYYCVQSSNCVFAGLFEISGDLKSRFFNKAKAQEHHYVYFPNKKPIEFHASQFISDFYSSDSAFEIQIGRSFFAKKDSEYVLEIHNSVFDLSLTAFNIVPGNPLTVSRYLSGEKTRGVHWRNPILRADSLGFFYYKDIKMPVYGILFHDHNWHNISGKPSINFIKNMKKWDWCILHDDESESSLLVVDANYEPIPFHYSALKLENSDLEIFTHDKDFFFEKNQNKCLITFGDKKVEIALNHEHFLIPYGGLDPLSRFVLAHHSTKSHSFGSYELFEKDRIISKGKAYVESFDLDGKLKK